MSLEIQLFPVLKDNYAYFLFDAATGAVGVVDPGEAAPIKAALAAAGRTVTHVLNTHHHGDHIDGDAALIEGTDALVAGPEADRHRIPALGIGLKQGDSYSVGETEFTIIETPGHTLGQIAFYSPSAKAVFTGDTLFSLGCGRMFEGTAEQMWGSMLRLRALPDDTLIYCGHEYTQSNCRFALTIEPDNAALKARAAEIAELRAAGKPTIPTTMGQERATNPFLRADEPSVQASLGMEGADPVAVFAEIRRRKDKF
jgi:hydroxyacylglutathione hydrolase